MKKVKRSAEYTIINNEFSGRFMTLNIKNNPMNNI